MKKLSRKVFLFIFLILSLFLISSIIIYNIQNYRKEYSGINRSLSFIEDISHKNNRPIPPRNSRVIESPKETDIDKLMIFNYEVYTVKIKNNKIDKIIGHNDNSSNFDVEGIALNIIGNKQEIKIGNLYNSKYAYNYKSKSTLVIMNLEPISIKLKNNLIISIGILLIIEIIIYIVANIMTKWITAPAIEAFNKQKDFIADASHELKTPLAVIMACSDELKSDKKNSKYVENIKYESDRMNKLITSLLDLSKLENGLSIENYKEENISLIAEKICSTFEAIAFENKITINTKIDKEIFFKCNKDEIEKLFSIILDNAIKHSYENSIIKFNLIHDRNSIIINIINSGEPIKSGDEEKIFERFYREDKSRKRDNNRYGLGLAIAKNIVNNHGGTIKAFSKDKKTTFNIVFKN